MPEGSRRRVGILGGTFNPPHTGHLIAAECVRDQLGLEKVVFVPAAVPPHKLNEKIIGAEHRLAMVRLAIKDNPFFGLSDVELKRPGTSFTVDTIAQLKQNGTGDDLHLIMGIDLLIEFYSWKDPTKILELCTIAAMNRPGFDMGMVDKELLNRVEVVNVPGIDISSTSIRRRVSSGRSIRYLVPPSVEEYILANSLYR